MNIKSITLSLFSFLFLSINAVAAGAEKSSTSAPTSKFANPFYGSLRVAIRSSSEGGTKTIAIKSAGTSRFGVKNSHPIGDELTAIYRFEWGLASNFSISDGSVRLAFVGIQGEDFGDLRLGRDWSGSYNFVGSKLDIFSSTPASTYDDFAYGDDKGHARLGSAVHYRNKLGEQLKLQISAQLGGDNKPDGVSSWVLGGEYQLSKNTNIGAYYSLAEGGKTSTDREQIGLSLSLKPASDLNITVASFSQIYAGEANEDFHAFDVAAVLNLPEFGKGVSLRGVYGMLNYDQISPKNNYKQLQIGLRKQLENYRLYAWFNTTKTETQANKNEFTIGARYDF
ncbi:MAG: porin [Candidatus Thioglobus sp.]|nr:porin [Candidatus Thioglobus sp.]